ncbi:MAG: AraC family transcriptional regulator [Cyanobacteria bacterium J06621_8]
MMLSAFISPKRSSPLISVIRHPLPNCRARWGLNDCTLKRGFREVFGTTAFGYLHEYRLEQARLLLLENCLNVAEIANQVGFTSYRSLSRGFRKKYDVTLKQYQAQFK